MDVKGPVEFQDLLYQLRKLITPLVTDLEQSHIRVIVNVNNFFIALPITVLLGLIMIDIHKPA
jgi:hypothetical protein